MTSLDRNVADKLKRKGGAPMGFLRRKPDTNTTTLAIITPGRIFTLLFFPLNSSLVSSWFCSTNYF